MLVSRKSKARGAFKLKQLLSLILSISCLFSASLFSPTAAAAATANTQKYSGQPLKSTVTVTATPGASVPIELQFKNLGTAVWSPEGKGYISVYTIKPTYHASIFRTKDWLSAYQPARLATASVKKGETGTIKFNLQAPQKAGTYSDTFQLASEDTSWIWSAYVTVKMTVTTASNSTPAAAAPIPTPTPDTSTQPIIALPTPLQGSLIYQSASRIEAPGGLQMTMNAIFQNDGTSAWKRYGIRLISTKSISNTLTIDPSDQSWASPEIPVVVNSIVVPHGTARLSFSFMVPPQHGTYEYRFVLFADGGVLDSAPIILPVTAINDLYGVPTTPTVPSTTPVENSLTGDPLIRVGLYLSDKTEEISSEGSYMVTNADGALLAAFPAGTHAQFWYDLSSRVYRITGNGLNFTSAGPVRFVQTGSAPIFTLWTFAGTSVSDNTFRGVIELHKNDPNDYIWVINELPLEQYLAGMGETSNVSPHEFQKSMVVVARSYAWYHLTHPGKHWNFTVDATYDQVYRGYRAEVRSPKIKLAAAETRGQIVTYNGTPVVTPYYSSSDGRTRDWTEVWGGGAKAWLVSVSCPYDAAAGRALLGHGVGMSAWDAIGRANAGATYDTILKYYYSGTALKTMY